MTYLSIILVGLPHHIVEYVGLRRRPSDYAAQFLPRTEQLLCFHMSVVGGGAVAAAAATAAAESTSALRTGVRQQKGPNSGDRLTKNRIKELTRTLRISH